MALKDPTQMTLLKKLISKKPSKYRNVKTVVDGITFDSKKEARQYRELEFLKNCGKIRNLRRQVEVPIDINEKHICSWIADFVYEEKLPYDCLIGGAVQWAKIYVDVKSEITRKLPVYRIKKKLVEAVHGIKIKEV